MRPNGRCWNGEVRLGNEEWRQTELTNSGYYRIHHPISFVALTANKYTKVKQALQNVNDALL